MGQAIQPEEVIPVLKVRNLVTKLQVDKEVLTVVDDLNFDLFHGKTLALVGESGCGKTVTAFSLLRILPLPFLKPTGEVLYKGNNIFELSEKKLREIRGAKISMIFQDPMSALNPVYTIGNQLIEVIELHLNIYDEEAIHLALEALQNVGIQDPQKCLNDYPHQLSGGMKQRVMIAMALLCKPDILIADEPTTALDVTIQKQVLDLIKQLQRENGMALLLITHDLGVVADMADDVIVMYLAQAVESGTARQIFHNPSHPYTQGLFKSRPTIHSHGEKLTPIFGNVPSIHQIPTGCRFHTRCPYVMEKCKSGQIPDFEIEPNHLAKCLLHDGSEESSQKLIQVGIKR